MTQETDRQLLKDIEAHLREMWDKRLLPASCWPVDLARRLTAALEAKQVDSNSTEFEGIKAKQADHIGDVTEMVQMPEPVAYIQHHKAGDNLEWDCPGNKYSALYTEQQVRALLTQHGIKIA